MAETILQRLGGESAIRAVVPAFYQKVFTDSSLVPFFEGIDRSGQLNKMINFLRAVFGEEDLKTNLRVSHQYLVERGLNDLHFDKTKNYLKLSLVEAGVDQELIGEIMEVVESTRDEVLDK